MRGQGPYNLAIHFVLFHAISLFIAHRWRQAEPNRTVGGARTTDAPERKPTFALGARKIFRTATYDVGIE